jgi:hypothetical protein
MHRSTLSLISALDGVGGRNVPVALSPGKRPGTHCIGGWVAPGPVSTDAENLAPTGIRSPDRPARSQSLYRLSYPSHIDGGISAKQGLAGRYRCPGSNLWSFENKP